MDHFSRRGFIGTATAAALAAIGRRGGAQTNSDIWKWLGARSLDDAGLKLGVASYSLRNFPRQQAIDMTRSLGIRYINLKSVHLAYDAPAEEFVKARAELAAAGLELVGGGMITFETD